VQICLLPLLRTTCEWQHEIEGVYGNLKGLYGARANTCVSRTDPQVAAFLQGLKNWPHNSVVSLQYSRTRQLCKVSFLCGRRPAAVSVS
jgi:hypothetical protein